jgi:hypothetical protein
MVADEPYSDSEAKRRMDEAVRRALATPHKPHKPLGKRKKRKVNAKKNSRSRRA